MSVISDIQAVSMATTRVLHGEDVTLRDSAGDISAEISDAIVSLDSASVGAVGDGPGDHAGVLRLAATHRTAAQGSLTATVRGQTLHIVSVGEVYGDSFRVELRRDEEEKTNLFDLSGNQAVWHEAD